MDVGNRIRLRRMQLGMSQTELGREAGDVTFQQVQKYERGTNRVSASRLQQIAGVLQVPVSYFFRQEDADDGDAMETVTATREGLQMAVAFAKIKDPAVRKSVLRMVKTLAGMADEND